MPIPGRSLRRDAALNRDKLVAAAAEVFAERGVDGPLDEIARRAGVSIGTLYNHFPHRDALLDDIFPALIEQMFADVEHALVADDPWAGFTGYLTTMFEHQARHRGLNDVMTQRYANAAHLVAACHRGFAKLQAVVERAQRAGVLRADFAMTDLAMVVWTMSRLISVIEPVAPGGWHRHLGFLLDGLRATAADPLGTPPMTVDQTAAALAGGSGVGG